MRTLLAAAFSACIISGPSYAEEPSLLMEGGSDAIISTLDGFYVQIIDQVSGNCFTNSDAVQTTVELTLRRNNFLVQEENAFFPYFVINVIGFRDQTEAGSDLGCSVYAQAFVSSWQILSVSYSEEEQTFVRVNFPISGKLMSSPGNANGQIREFAIKSTETLANDILRARDNIFTKFPHIEMNFADHVQ